MRNMSARTEIYQDLFTSAQECIIYENRFSQLATCRFLNSAIPTSTPKSEYPARFNDSNLKLLIHVTGKTRRVHRDWRKTHVAATTHLYRRSNIKQSEFSAMRTTIN